MFDSQALHPGAPADDAARDGDRAPFWAAELCLRLERRDQRTVLAHAHHSGPLRVQKPLYPETPGRADLLILHPPAGIAGGDRLSVEVRLEAGAQARITTPGAGKWYRSSGASARQDVHLQIGADAVMEWLPQEAIVFDGARAHSRTRIECSEHARGCGWDILVLGRRASGERFARGHMHQSTSLRRAGRLLWQEHARLDADDGLRDSPLGWHAAQAFGSFWMLGLPADESLLERCREVAEPGVHLGLTRFDHGLWLARALGDSVERIRAAFTRIWALVRPALCGAPGIAPRIWAT